MTEISYVEREVIADKLLTVVSDDDEVAAVFTKRDLELIVPGGEVWDVPMLRQRRNMTQNKVSTSPFPLPDQLPCPYCSEKGTRQSFNDSTCEIHFAHHMQENKRVGKKTIVVLHTMHQFVAVWHGEWQAQPRYTGSSTACERLEKCNGHKLTDWESCDRD